MSFVRPLALAARAFLQLGPGPLALYARYRAGLLAGCYRRASPARPWPLPGQGQAGEASSPLWNLPAREELAALLGERSASLLAEAGEILEGRVRLFGGPPVAWQWNPPGELRHWSAYESGAWTEALGDLRQVWEHGRFGWAFTLGRACRLSGDDRYAEAFWRHAEAFLQANPPNLGPHWASAQEAALRLIALAFAFQVFEGSPRTTPERRAFLLEAIAAHAGRIPPTLAYARAQNNNHLLSEAAGLLTAGLLLPGHPQARRWRSLGWRWFNAGLQAQIHPDGAYAQHSANYHRLALALALWVDALLKGLARPGAARLAGLLPAGEYPPLSRARLAAATRWLLALLDPETGRLPNLGPNDGSQLLPLAACPFDDCRPILQAASRAFLGEQAFAPGPWDELSAWLGAAPATGVSSGQPTRLLPAAAASLHDGPHVLRSPTRDSWAYLRAARFGERPGHADQLHLDLWWRGLNLAQDAGTYRYNAPPPWENALAGAAVHNTLTLNGRDQMTRAGRFLWLDWAQARLLEGRRRPDGSFERLLAEHDGYRRLGALHRRAVSIAPAGWLVEDQVLPAGDLRWRLRRSLARALAPGRGSPVFSVRLHWLFPDWPWQMGESDEGFGASLWLESPHGRIALEVSIAAQGALPCRCSLVRAGELLAGEGPADPTRGWCAPTYACRLPALSFALEVRAPLPLSLRTEWSLP